MTELKPCPICGKTDMVSFVQSLDGDTVHSDACISCVRCGLTLYQKALNSSTDTNEAVAHKWNIIGEIR